MEDILTTKCLHAVLPRYFTAESWFISFIVLLSKDKPVKFGSRSDGYRLRTRWHGASTAAAFSLFSPTSSVNRAHITAVLLILQTETGFLLDRTTILGDICIYQSLIQYICTPCALFSGILRVLSVSFVPIS